MHKSVALLHMFCKKHEQEKIEWKDSELQSCRQRKSTGGISDGVDTCRCHSCKKNREGTESIPGGVSYACTKKRKGIDMTALRFRLLMRKEQ